MAEMHAGVSALSLPAREASGKTVLVDIRLTDEREFRGHLHLKTDESLQDFMNSSDAFIPVRTVAGEVHLLNKRWVEEIHQLESR
jgi:hypothetical protein